MCDLCELGKRVMVGDVVLVLRRPNELMITMTDKRGIVGLGSRVIKFCPECGRKLEEASAIRGVKAPKQEWDW